MQPTLRLSLVTLSMAAVYSSFAQLPRIVLEPAAGGAPQVFLALDDAIAAVQADDRLYFSGGTFSTTAPLVLTEPIHFIGAGIHPDSASITLRTKLVQQAPIQVNTSASNSTFTGISFDSSTGACIQYGDSDTNDDPTGILFERCEFVQDVALTAISILAGPNFSSSNFNECLFRGRLDGGDLTTAVVTRSIFEGSINTMDGGGLLVDHCVFFDTGINNSHFSTVQNSIFSGAIPGLFQCNGSSVSNSLTTHTAFFGNSGSNTSETNSFTGQSNVFVNETNGQFDFTDDLHIAAGSVALGGAIDGTDMGLYGSPFPAKPGFLPYNPHYQAVTIDPATDANGDLPINIKVKAQTY
ncbi:MAG: hypothetical protein KDB88_13585 [Flavobacteriales bacterium]|nr:hypothetical protein [Flavobacteriales bacterium]